MITPVCTWRPMLAQTLAARTCFQHSSRPMLCRTLVFSLPEWFAVVNVTHSPVMCRPWADSGSSTFRTGCHTVILKVTSGLVSGRHWAKFRLKVGKFKHSTKIAVIGPALDRCKQWHWPNNNGRPLAADIVPYYHLRQFALGRGANSPAQFKCSRLCQ